MSGDRWLILLAVLAGLVCTAALGVRVDTLTRQLATLEAQSPPPGAVAQPAHGRPRVSGESEGGLGFPYNCTQLVSDSADEVSADYRATKPKNGLGTFFNRLHRPHRPRPAFVPGLGPGRHPSTRQRGQEHARIEVHQV